MVNIHVLKPRISWRDAHSRYPFFSFFEYDRKISFNESLFDCDLPVCPDSGDISTFRWIIGRIQQKKTTFSFDAVNLKLHRCLTEMSKYCRIKAGIEKKWNILEIARHFPIICKKYWKGGNTNELCANFSPIKNVIKNRIKSQTRKSKRTIRPLYGTGR